MPKLMPILHLLILFLRQESVVSLLLYALLLDADRHPACRFTYPTIRDGESVDTEQDQNGRQQKGIARKALNKIQAERK